MNALSEPDGKSMREEVQALLDTCGYYSDSCKICYEEVMCDRLFRVVNPKEFSGDEVASLRARVEAAEKITEGEWEQIQAALDFCIQDLEDQDSQDPQDKMEREITLSARDKLNKLVAALRGDEKQ